MIKQSVFKYQATFESVDSGEPKPGEFYATLKMRKQNYDIHHIRGEGGMVTFSSNEPIEKLQVTQGRRPDMDGVWTLKLVG